MGLHAALKASQKLPHLWVPHSRLCVARQHGVRKGCDTGPHGLPQVSVYENASRVFAVLKVHLDLHAL